MMKKSRKKKFRLRKLLKVRVEKRFGSEKSKDVGKRIEVEDLYLGESHSQIILLNTIHHYLLHRDLERSWKRNLGNS